MYAREAAACRSPRHSEWELRAGRGHSGPASCFWTSVLKSLQAKSDVL